MAVSRFINNEFVAGVDKKTFEVINPTTEEVICSVVAGKPYLSRLLDSSLRGESRSMLMQSFPTYRAL